MDPATRSAVLSIETADKLKLGMKYILLTETFDEDPSQKFETLYSIDVFFCEPRFTTR